MLGLDDDVDVDGLPRLRAQPDFASEFNGGGRQLVEVYVRVAEKISYILPILRDGINLQYTFQYLESWVPIPKVQSTDRDIRQTLRSAGLVANFHAPF